MSRAFTVEDILTLPRFTGASAAQLLKELLASARAEAGLPPWLEPDLVDLAEAYAALPDDLTQSHTEPGRSLGAAPADLAEDNAFIALYEWLSAWARLPEAHHPLASAAQLILAAVFPQGRRFLAIRPSDEWQEADRRLKLIEEQGYGVLVAELGGQPFLDELGRVHEAYGQALCQRSDGSGAEASPHREAREAAAEVMRAYVLRVSAHVRPKDPATVALADRLLAPLVRWRDALGAETTEEQAPAEAATA